MSLNLNFITNDETVRSKLSQSITQSPHDRHDVYRFIGEDFCRNLHNLVETLRDHMMKEENTIIFVNGGYRVLGLIIFRIIHIPINAIMVEVICVPETGQRGIGTQLLNKVKELAETVSLPIYLFPLDESVEFYIKNGFIEHDGGFYVFSPSTTTTTTTTTTGGKSKPRTSTRTRPRKKMLRKAKTRRHHRRT